MKTGLRCIISASMFAAALISGSTVKANDYAWSLTLPGGLACEFDLFLAGSGSDHRVVKEFTDRYGVVIRGLEAGKGQDLYFENLATGASLETKANGATSHTSYNPDGTQTGRSTGHNLLILFPSDDPPGPSTTLHVGQVVYTIGTDGNWTVEKVTGKTTDICAALSE